MGRELQFRMAIAENPRGPEESSVSVSKGNKLSRVDYLWMHPFSNTSKSNELLVTRPL